VALRNKKMDTAGVMGSTELMHVAAARSFSQYVAMVVGLNAKHLNRLRRTLRRTALADGGAGRDHAAEERWEGEGGNSRNVGMRRRR
jgi:hypothetical protein